MKILSELISLAQQLDLQEYNMSGFDNNNGVLNNLNSNISGILSTKPAAQYASGARCILKINGKLVGFAFGVSWRITTSYIENNTIDDYLPAELIPQRISVDGTISALHIPGQSATTELWQSDVLSFLFHRYVQIEVRDSQTDQLLFHTNQAVFTSRQEDIKVDQLSNVSLTWKAIGWNDEKPPETPENFDKESGLNDTKLQTDLSSRLQLPKFGIPKIGF
jgi:hypothetical protein